MVDEGDKKRLLCFKRGGEEGEGGGAGRKEGEKGKANGEMGERDISFEQKRTSQIDEKEVEEKETGNEKQGTEDREEISIRRTGS